MNFLLLLQFSISELILQDPECTVRSFINETNMCRADEVTENIFLEGVVEFLYLFVLVIFAEAIGRILSRYRVGFGIFNFLLCIRFLWKMGYKILKVSGKIK